MKSTELSLERQINHCLKKAKSQEVVVFTTTPKRKRVLSHVVNYLAKKHTDIHFQVFFDKEYHAPMVVICPHEDNKKEMSYTWVEQSNLTGKFLVMASPPGAYGYGCITVWKDQDKAIEISSRIFNSILNMPLKDWELRQGEFKKLLDSLPDDDDEAITVPFETALKLQQLSPTVIRVTK